MIGVLGSTCDPTVLVAGSLAALRGDADELEARAGALEDAAADVEHRIVEAWIGDAADAYAARRQTLTEGLRGVAQVYAIAVAVLRVHADRLEWGQGRAQVAIDLWDRGCAATTAAPRRIGTPTLGVRASQRPLGASAVAIMTRPSVADPILDPLAGTATKVRAEQILTGARNEVTASAHAAQEVLDELSAGLPDGRWHADQFLGGLGDWVTGIAGLVATFNAYRAFVDPVGYATDAREMAAAMYAIPGQLVDDPVGTAETLLDVRTLRDNPGRWWGRMAPDIAMSVATAGVGLAAKSGRLGVAATRVVDEVADTAAMVGVASAADAPAMAAVRFEGLLAHEAAGGHTLSKHVGLTAEDLANRLATSRVPAVSSFTSREIADAAIAKVLEANRPAISAWLARGAAPTDSVFTGIDANPVGTVLRPGATVPVVSHAVRVILRAEPGFPGGIRIQTAYPE